MVGVVVMAGGKCKSSILENTRDFAAYPFMKFTEFIGGYSFEVPIRGYKPVKKVEGNIDGIVKDRPMIAYVVDKLARAKNIEEIVVVGEEKILGKSLKENLPEHSYSRFEDIGRIVQQAGSFKDNGFKGYSSLSPRVLDASNGYALFMFSDAVNCTPYGIDKFVEDSRGKNADVVLGVATENQLKKYLKYFRRPPLRLVDDINFSAEDRDNDGRVALRSADRIYANLARIKNPVLIDGVYNYRRLAKIIVHPKKFIEFLEDDLNINFWEYKSKYQSKQLALSEVLTNFSEKLGAPVVLLKVEDAVCSLDLDAERDIPASKRMNHDLIMDAKKGK